VSISQLAKYEHNRFLFADNACSIQDIQLRMIGWRASTRTLSLRSLLAGISHQGSTHFKILEGYTWKGPLLSALLFLADIAFL